MSASITLVANKICPFAHRAWITAREKGLEFELREVSLKNKEPYFTETYHKAYAHDPSSDGKVPILIHGDNILAESDLISWYLAETFSSGTELIPKDPFQRAKLRHFIAEYPGKVIGAFYAFKDFHTKPKEAQEASLQKWSAGLKALNDQIVGPYVLGDQFTLADILIYPWFERATVLEAYLNVHIDEKYTKLQNWIREVSSRKSVAEIAQNKELFLEGYKEYFAPPSTATL